MRSPAPPSQERDKLRLAKLVKFGDKVSRPPNLPTIESQREWCAPKPRMAKDGLHYVFTRLRARADPFSFRAFPNNRSRTPSFEAPFQMSEETEIKVINSANP